MVSPVDVSNVNLALFGKYLQKGFKEWKRANLYSISMARESLLFIPGIKPPHADNKHLNSKGGENERGKES